MPMFIFSKKFKTRAKTQKIEAKNVIMNELLLFCICLHEWVHFFEIFQSSPVCETLSLYWRDWVFTKKISVRCSSVILTKSLKKNIQIWNHLWRDMQNSNDLFIVEFLASIFGVFARVLNIFENMNIGMNLS